MSKHTQPALASLQHLLASVEKSAEAFTEPGSIGGQSSHPSAKVDDQAEAAQEGARSREYTEDIKKDQGVMGVESSGQSPGPQEGEQTKIGPLEPKTTGKDPANETSSVKGDKDDPGTSHPATTEDGKKYGSDLSKLSLSQQLASLTAVLEKNSQEIMLEINNMSKQASQAPAVQPATAPAPAPAAAAAAAEAQKAAEAGYDLAGLFADVDLSPEDKVAFDQSVMYDVSRVIGDASFAAVKVAEMIYGKQAEDEAGGEVHAEEAPPEKKQEGGVAPAPGGEPPLGDEGMPPAEELLQLLLSGGGGGDPGMGGMGGADGAPADMMGAGGPPADGDPTGGMGGGGEGGGGDAALLQQILQELNVPPEQAAPKIAAELQRRYKSAAASRRNSRKEAMTRTVKEILGIRR